MPIQSAVAEPFVSGLCFGECPRWHDGRLWYSDFFDHAVFSVSTGGERRTEVAFDGEPAGLGWLPDGRLLINSRLDQAILRREPDGTLVRHGELAPWAKGYANDMVVAANGQAYAGNFGFDLERIYDGTLDLTTTRPTTSLVRVDPDGTSHEAATDLAFPNGAVITDDGALLIIAESMGGVLSAFDRGPDGTLSGRRQWAAPPGIAPDGICLCADGTVWVANAFGPECVRVAEGGAIVERVSTSQNCYACMLGGPDRTTLYLVTAPTSEEAKARVERNGAIERADTSVPGAGLP
ncbi:MAG: SMP-30/gluconolactonase/LRE family protein [Acidimicrobiales bacterium]